MFQSDRGHLHKSSIFVMSAKGTGVKEVAYGTRPTWSSDGRIVFVLPGGRLADIRPGDSNPERLDSLSGGHPSVSPDAAYVAFTRDLGPYQSNELVVSRIDGSARHVVAEVDGPVSWSPTGRRIVFEALRNDHRGLFSVNRDGTHLIRITRGSGIYQEPAWSPNASRIALQGSFVGLGSDLTDIFVISADGTGLRRLTKTAAVDEQTPAWSPDGNRILFSRGYSCSSLYVMAADGTGVRRLTNPKR